MSKATRGVLMVGGMRTHLELFAPTFAADPRFDIVGVTEEREAEPDVRERSAEAARWLGVPFLEDFGAALSLPAVDVVCVCPAIERRARVLRECAASGKHLYLDKPLVASPAELRSVASSFVDNLAVHRAYSFAEAPWMAAAFRAVADGGLGDIVGAHVEVIFAKGTPDIEDPRTRDEDGRPTYTFYDAKRDLAEIGFYGLSAVARVAPDPIESVFATTGNYFFDAHRRRGIEDFGSVIVRTRAGFVGTVTAGRSGTASHPALGVQHMRVIGTEDAAAFDAWKPRLSVHSTAAAPLVPPDPIDPLSMWPSTTTGRGTPPVWLSDVTVMDWAGADVARFADAIDSGDDGGMGIAHAVQVNAIILAAYESAGRRQPVRISEVLEQTKEG